MTDQNVAVAARWQNYVMESGAQLDQFWQLHLAAQRDLLLILGRGFDPRMCLGLRTVLAAGGGGKRDVWVVDFDEGLASPSKTYEPLVQANWSELQQLVSGKGVVDEKRLRMWSNDGRRVGSRSAAGLVAAIGDLVGYSDIVLDVSALPRAIFFPLIAKLLHLLDEGPWLDGEVRPPNLHVLVAENAKLDFRIRDEGIDETAAYVHPFGGGLEMEATADHPKVWIPVLGERQHAQLERIYDLVMPDEIAPVLPSPSVNPRRADDLLLEYRELLFDRLRVEPGNFIFAAERNPFEVYRQIRRAILHYKEALEPLGGCRAVLSALSTKLLSVGALLVAYELKRSKVEVGIAHVECQGYSLEQGSSGDGDLSSESELHGLWLWGECYEP